MAFFLVAAVALVCLPVIICFIIIFCICCVLIVKKCKTQPPAQRNGTLQQPGNGTSESPCVITSGIGEDGEKYQNLISRKEKFDFKYSIEPISPGSI